MMSYTSIRCDVVTKSDDNLKLCVVLYEDRELKIFFVQFRVISDIFFRAEVRRKNDDNFFDDEEIDLMGSDLTLFFSRRRFTFLIHVDSKICQYFGFWQSATRWWDSFVKQ